MTPGERLDSNAHYPPELLEAYRGLEQALQNQREARGRVDLARSILREEWLKLKDMKLAISGTAFRRVFPESDYFAFSGLRGDEDQSERGVGLSEAEIVSGIGNALIIRLSEKDLRDNFGDTTLIKPNGLIAIKVESALLLQKPETTAI